MNSAKNDEFEKTHILHRASLAHRQEGAQRVLMALLEKGVLEPDEFAEAFMATADIESAETEAAIAELTGKAEDGPMNAYMRVLTRTQG
jgi:hypothetical protein